MTLNIKVKITFQERQGFTQIFLFKFNVIEVFIVRFTHFLTCETFSIILISDINLVDQNLVGNYDIWFTDTQFFHKRSKNIHNYIGTFNDFGLDLSIHKLLGPLERLLKNSKYVNYFSCFVNEHQKEALRYLFSCILGLLSGTVTRDIHNIARIQL